MSEVVVTSQENLRNEVRYGAGHSFITDEPVAAGGEDAGPDPYTLLLAALGSCISMTLKLYARRKQWPLESVTVHLKQNRIHSKDCQECRSRQRRLHSPHRAHREFHWPPLRRATRTPPRDRAQMPHPQNPLLRDRHRLSLGSSMSSGVSVRSSGWNQSLTGHESNSFTSPLFGGFVVRLRRYSPRSMRLISNCCPDLM